MSLHGVPVWSTSLAIVLHTIRIMHALCVGGLQEILTALDTNLPPALRAKCIPFLNGFA
jgi:hypothetical protein